MSEEPTAEQTLEKDPSDWVTGDEPATGAQRSYLETLTRAADEQVPEDLGADTEAEAADETVGDDHADDQGAVRESHATIMAENMR